MKEYSWNGTPPYVPEQSELDYTYATVKLSSIEFNFDSYRSNIVPTLYMKLKWISPFFFKKASLEKKGDLKCVFTVATCRELGRGRSPS